MAKARYHLLDFPQRRPRLGFPDGQIKGPDGGFRAAAPYFRVRLLPLLCSPGHSRGRSASGPCAEVHLGAGSHRRS